MEVEVSALAAKLKEARKRSIKRLSVADKTRVVREQMERPTIEYLTNPVTGTRTAKRVAISRVIKTIEQSLSEADLRLQMLKVHVEIAMMGTDEERVKEMIEKCHYQVQTLHETVGFAGTFGGKQ